MQQTTGYQIVAKPPVLGTKTPVQVVSKPCDCMASVHGLLGNCLNCGKIVCALEEEGICTFCDLCPIIKPQNATRLSPVQYQEMSRLRMAFKYKTATINSDKRSQKTQSSNRSLELLDEQRLLLAEESMKRLIQFDKTNEKRTEIIDDSSDFFNTTSSWLTPAELEAKIELQREYLAWMQAKENKRAPIKYTIDLVNGSLIQELDDNNGDNDGQIASLRAFLTSKKLLTTKPAVVNKSVSSKVPVPAKTDAKARPLATDLPNYSPIYIPQNILLNTRKQNKSISFRSSYNEIIQGSDYLIYEKAKFKDTGKCMAMKQPWASLLVMGIKTVEGRVWDTAHRGTLWISSTSQAPSEEDIATVHDFYRELYYKKYRLEMLKRDPQFSPSEYERIKLLNEIIEFPESYPVGVLLGKVDIAEVLPNEKYLQLLDLAITDEIVESDSAYVFICENAMELNLKFPVVNDHKIFPLDNTVHLAAKKQLETLN